MKTESGNVENALCLPLQAPFVLSSFAARNAPEIDLAMKELQRKLYASGLLCPSAPPDYVLYASRECYRTFEVDLKPRF